MAIYSFAVAVQPGFWTTLLDAAGAGDINNGNKSQQFCVLSSPASMGIDKVIECVVSGTFTVGTIDLEMSTDSGATWAPRQGSTALDVNANKGFSLNLQPGVLYRLNLKTFTGTSVTIKANGG